MYWDLCISAPAEKYIETKKKIFAGHVQKKNFDKRTLIKTEAYGISRDVLFVVREWGLKERFLFFTGIFHFPVMAKRANIFAINEK